MLRWVLVCISRGGSECKPITEQSVFTSREGTLQNDGPQGQKEEGASQPHGQKRGGISGAAV